MTLHSLTDDISLSLVTAQLLLFYALFIASRSALYNRGHSATVCDLVGSYKNNPELGKVPVQFFFIVYF